VWQVVCSPLRNPLNALFRYLNVVAFWRPLGRPMHALARRAGARRPEVRWGVVAGPWFDNALATVEVQGRSAHVRWQASVSDDGAVGLRTLHETALT
jgi:hypothetical protein